MTVKQNLAYLRYVLRHKYYVFLGCLKLRVPIMQALAHDNTKFLPREYFPYLHHFYNPDGSKRDIRNPDGSYNPAEQPEAFQRAWLYHQRNPHHWQAHVSIGDDGKLVALPIPEKYLREMIADWYGAGMAIHNEANPLPWYKANRQKMIIHPVSRLKLEFLLYSAFEIL